MKMPRPGMMIEIQVGMFQEYPTRVIGIVKSAKVRRQKLKYFEPGLYVEFEKVLWVSQRWDDVAYHPVMPFFALKGEWREVAEDEVLGRVL